jgi:uncharacterized protein
MTDSELDNLANVLKTFGGKNAMNVEQIDGFLAALICSPVSILPREYLPVIWGDDMINEVGFTDQLIFGFTDQPILQDFLSLVARHKSAIAHTLRSGDIYTPILLASEDGVFRANDWANGFLQGMKLRKEEWATLFDDKDHGGSLVPILALAHEHDPDPEMRSYKEPISEEKREKLIIGAAAGVMNIYGYFRKQETTDPYLAGVATYRRVTPKTGRNEPCPCGSGKKFKHCCGKITLH